MNCSVPYLPKKTIERAAEALLAEYGRARAVILAPPIPVDCIIEKYLRLSIDFDDMHVHHDIPRSPSGQVDVIGTIYGDGRIFIDNSLDPDKNSTQEGRYRFTLAHESGHWRLHKHLIIQDTAQLPLFGEESDPKFICRSSQAKRPEEWQADFYASCLLMPRKMIFAAWKGFFPDCKPRVLKQKTPIAHSFVEIARINTSIAGGDISEAEDEALERFCRPLAKHFLVSPIAMRIRLENLGLLYRVVPDQPLLASM